MAWTVTTDDGTDVARFDDAAEELHVTDPRLVAWLNGRDAAAWSPVGPFVSIPPDDEDDAVILLATWGAEQGVTLVFGDGAPDPRPLLLPGGIDVEY